MTGYVLSVANMGASIGAVASAIFPAIGAVLAYIFLKEKIFVRMKILKNMQIGLMNSRKNTTRLTVLTLIRLSKMKLELSLRKFSSMQVFSSVTKKEKPLLIAL